MIILRTLFCCETNFVDCVCIISNNTKYFITVNLIKNIEKIVFGYFTKLNYYLQKIDFT